MGGYGSGRHGGKCKVESAFRLDIDWCRREGMIRPNSRTCGGLHFQSYHAELEVSYESRLAEEWDSWIRLQYRIKDYWTGEPLKIDDKIQLRATRPKFGGIRWWFVCPRSRRRVRILYLPLGGRHFWSRRSYRLAYGSQSESVYDRALRKSRKLHYRLGGDPADDHYPDKPPRMRWTTYNRTMGRLLKAEKVADTRLIRLAQRWMSR
jgi:hypothetical protein